MNAASISKKKERTKSHTVQRKQDTFFSAMILQKKHSVGTSNDIYETEADRIADQVVTMPDSQITSNGMTNTTIQRKCTGCKEELQKKNIAESVTPIIQRSSLINKGETKASNTVSSKITSSKGGGKPITDNTRNFMESRFGSDFSNVNIHTDLNAVQLSSELNAQAFTVGNDIYFNEGKYNPNSSQGKHLLAHELTHTLQQEGRSTSNNTIQKEEGEETPVMNESRASFLQMIQKAISHMNNEDLADSTFSDTLYPFFQELSQPDNIVWRASDGAETNGTGGRFRLRRRRGSRTPSGVRYKLIIDESMTEEGFQGLHNESERTITLNKSKLTSIESIRNTLYHEGIHMIASLMQRYGENAIGGTRDISVQSLVNNLNHSEKQRLRRRISFLREAVNTNRSSRGSAGIPETDINRVVDFLWDEISVRAQTFYFELLIWLGERRRISDGLPSPNYLTIPFVKKYLKQAEFITEADIGHFEERENQLIESIQRVLMFSQRLLIRGIGVGNLYLPHPLEPKESEVIISRIRPDIGLMGTIEPPSFLNRIIEDANTLE